jgi:hypothetical protein
MGDVNMATKQLNSLKFLDAAINHKDYARPELANVFEFDCGAKATTNGHICHIVTSSTIKPDDLIPGKPKYTDGPDIRRCLPRAKSRAMIILQTRVLLAATDLIRPLRRLGVGDMRLTIISDCHYGTILEVKSPVSEFKFKCAGSSPSDFDGDPIKVVLNLEYVQDSLLHATTNNVVIHYYGSGEPVLFEIADNAVALLMPYNTGE